MTTSLRRIDPTAVFGPPGPDEDPLLAELAAVALDLAGAASELAAAAFGQTRARVDTKSTATDMVSEVDREAEAAVARVLAERRPDDGLLGEEGASKPGRSGVHWIVDPLDGTTNYLFGVPSWSVSVAAQRNGETVVGVVVDPSRSETWASVAGRGGRLDGARVHVAEGRSTVATALVATGFSYDAVRRDWQGRAIAHLAPRVRDLRRFGSAALDLCWVGAGRVDAYFEWGLHAWDYAAGMLICREAGGMAGVEANTTVVATTPSLWEPLRALLADAGALDDVPPQHPA